MYEPVQSEMIVAAIKASIDDVNITIAEVGRRIGKGSSWLSSVLSRVRDGQTLTMESVRLMRPHLPSVEERLRAAGWYCPRVTARAGRPVPATRSTQHLRAVRTSLELRRSELDRQIDEISRQIEVLEDMSSGDGV